MFASENYYFVNGPMAERVWDSSSKRTIGVPAIFASDTYVERIKGATADARKGSVRSRIKRFRSNRADTNLRKPTIDRVLLHPCYDIIGTGGPMGSHYLNEDSYSGLPDRLEDFSDAHLAILLNRLIVPASELQEIGDLERKLKEDNPNYRFLQQELTP